MKLFKYLFQDKLTIYDDVFPYLLTGFRIAEYNYYINYFNKVKILSTSNIIDFEIALNEYKTYFPRFVKKIKKYSELKRVTSTLAYTVFVNNIYNFINKIENSRQDFVFTLYPGGGFHLEEKETDEKLKRVFNSKFFKEVIVTQKISKEYLVSKKLCDENKINFIYGSVHPSNIFNGNNYSKKKYKINKKTFDVCFVANKYTPQGVDKGYNMFIEAANHIAKVTNDIFFHVVGPFGPDDYPINFDTNRIQFYGIQYRDFFPEFYASMDIILSPNIPFKRNPGDFDGFPTGAVVEAGLNGVAMFCTDILNLNMYFKNGEDIVILEYQLNDIVEKILYYYTNLDLLYSLSEKGKAQCHEIFNIDRQMEKRIKILEKYI